MTYIRLAIPHHIYNTRQGTTIGLDAYFWNTLRVEARRALLARPASLLQPPSPETPTLTPKTTPTQQLQDAERLLKGQILWAGKHARWNLKRLLTPYTPPPEDAREYQLAAAILQELAPLEPTGQTLYLHITIETETLKIIVDGREDPNYNWLATNDPSFNREIRRLTKTYTL